MILGVVGIAIGLGVAIFVGWRTGQWVVFIQMIAMSGFGAFVFVRLIRMLARRHEGGDVCWIVKPDSVEIRGFFGQREVPFRSIEWVLFERGWSRHLVCLTLTPRAVIDGTMLPSIWLDQREYDARGMQAILRERVAIQAPKAEPHG